MSNHLAIATVTASLQRLLQSAIQRDVDGARVTTLKPNSIGSSTPESGVNLFLYQAAYNSALRNGDTAAFRSKKGPTRRQSSLDLFYILSTYGNETELEPQRLLGSVVRTFSDKTVVTPELIQQAIADSSYLANSDLATQTQKITINPVEMSTDELSKVWSTFFQAPYSLSLVYAVRAVVIEGEDSLARALPVRERYVGGVQPFPAQPTLEKVIAQTGADSPIEANSIVRLLGKELQSQREYEDISIQVGTTVIQPKSISDREILIHLSDAAATLKAGIQTVQVIHAVAHTHHQSSVTSNALPFVLRPAITSTQVGEVEGIDDDPRNGVLQVITNLTVGAQQRVVLTLNEWTIETAPETPATYLFDVPARSQDSKHLVISFTGVKPAEYLVRLQIDGADSLLGVDSDPNSKTFNWFNSPRVTI